MGRGRLWLRRAGWFTGIGAVFSVSAGFGMLAVIYAMVLFGDDSHLQEEAIKARITEETAIFMLDEQTQIGSFFDNAHRTYINIDEIPAHMINAIIAAEDKNFYHHVGVDPIALAKAGLGVLAGGRIRGASTLTQQAVRNILGWWEVTVSRKFREWVAALQLERLYDKRQILEFYLNQFYVSGNGNGIGIAARYYFNKDVRDLDLVESAFIAGSVKGPSLYDPFIQFTHKRRARSVERAFHRKNYVLSRMHEQGWIDDEQYAEAKEKPVKFNRGRFRSQEVALTQLIKQELEKKEILEALGIESSREISGGGFKVFTTIDGDLQEGAQLGMRRNLSRLETILDGYKVEAPERFTKLRGLIPHDFYYGKIAKIGGTKEKPELELTFGLPTCVVPYESLMRRAKIVDLPFGKGWQKQLDAILKELKVGDVVFTEIMEYDPEKHDAVCELHRRPRVNGGMIAIDKGEVRAVVSGFDTKGFNRAMDAKRPPGSVFKPLVYFAALQLGWSILDRVDNQLQVFPFQGKFYYPQPDHQSPYAETSMLWAGILSENLASIAMASTLVEKLNFNQFRQLMDTMGLLPERNEAPRDYHYRVAKKVGVQLDNEGVREFQLQNAISDLLLDVQYTSTAAFQANIEKLWWGRGYAGELQAIYQMEDDKVSVKRRASRIVLVKNNYLRMVKVADQLKEDWTAISDAVGAQGYQEAFADPSIQHVFERFRVLPGANARPALGYYLTLEDEVPSRPVVDQEELDTLLLPAGRNLNAMDIQAIWGGNILFGSADISLGDVLLDGWMGYQRVLLLGQYIDQHYAEVNSRQVEYDLHRYWQHHDFRIALGLEYLVALTKAMGVESKLEPVLSYPLGTNDVTVAEVAKIYQTFISGEIYRFYEEGPPNQLNFIRRIEDRFGNVLFEPERKPFQLAKPEFAMQMREVLRRVVTHGTGRMARGELYVTMDQTNEEGKPAQGKSFKIRTPAFGKTGTTNDFTNAYFAGFFPYPVAKNEPLRPENSYVIASYVGYDLNKPMKHGWKSISGASGALPAWINLAKAIIEKKKYNEYLDTFDLNILSRKTWPLDFDNETTPLNIDMPRGIVLNRRAVDNESYALTDIDTEGESDFNEFRAKVVQATIRIPLDDSGSALRIFAPFASPDDTEAKITESKVEDPVSKLSKLIPDQATTPDEEPATNPVDQHLDDLFGADGADDSSTSLPENTDSSATAAAEPETGPEITDPNDLFGDLETPQAVEDEEPTPTDDEFIEEELW